mmetsp:Transcript_46364/g.119655  ORF Transcript_46364/g.119655 Transcript_46364/m.119655 type:complete len:228 (-) Transcript_46364:238-921(-)
MDDVYTFIKLLFHQQQESQLCALHCINNLVQQDMFSAPDLMHIAETLDAKEKRVLGHIDGDEFESSNVADDGNFSIQVISEALKALDLECVPLSSPDVSHIAADPTQGHAYICHLHSHWFAIRRVANVFVNLNSSLDEPEIISNTYLSVWLAQLQTEGYSIFLVCGNFPPCPADAILLEEDGIAMYRKERRDIDAAKAREMQRKYGGDPPPLSIDDIVRAAQSALKK